ILKPVLLKQFHHRRSKTTREISFFNCDDQPFRARECEQQRRVEWLHKACVDDGCLNAIFRQAIGGCERRVDHRAVSDDRDLTTITEYLAFADLQQLRLARDINTDAIAARVAHRRRSSVLQHRKHHVAHLAFIFRRHHDDVWNGTQISDVEQSVMRLPVAAGNTTTVKTELHVQILYADVVYQLIETALQER